MSPLNPERPTLPPRSVAAAPEERLRFLSEAECRDLARRLMRFATGGYTTVAIHSVWTGNIRWARNRVSTSGEVLNHYIEVQRTLRGAESGIVILNDVSDDALRSAVQQAERMAAAAQEQPFSDLLSTFTPEVASSPALFSEATYQLDADQRAAAAHQLVQSAVDAGMLSAGYVEVSAHSLALLDSLDRVRYFPYTQAQYSVTVRDPKGTGSGWAGVDSHDWTKIDGQKLSAIALKKCVASRDPVRVEPGRYTVILEPQAVCDFVRQLLAADDIFSLPLNVGESQSYFTQPPFLIRPAQLFTDPGQSKIGKKVIDERLTISVDPMDPELGFPPFDPLTRSAPRLSIPVFQPATWIKNGVLTELAYDYWYGVERMGTTKSRLMPGAFRMSGGTTTMEEMIATTQRGLLVTRLSGITLVDMSSQTYRGYTRDGLWLIENGKILHPVKNLMFIESVLFALNKVVDMGVPQRAFHPVMRDFYDTPAPVIVPPLKINDFNFIALADAV